MAGKSKEKNGWKEKKAKRGYLALGSKDKYSASLLSVTINELGAVKEQEIKKKINK